MLKKPMVFDLHCDTPWYLARNKAHHIKPQRLRSQGYLGAVFAHFVTPRAKYPFVEAVKMIGASIDCVNGGSTLQHITSHREIVRSRANILFGVEGGHIFDHSFQEVDALHALGVRVFTITWNNSNRLAHSAFDNDRSGLTKKGKEYVRRLRRYEAIIDMSHASTRTVLDVCDLCENPIIASHSCVRALNPAFPRNISDAAIKAIYGRGGVVAVNFSKYHLGKHSIADHIDYLCQEYGAGCAAIGSDFDGINDPVIPGPGSIGRVERALRARGYKTKDIERILSGNFLRVLKTI